MNTPGTFKFFITYQYICTLNEEPTDPGKSHNEPYRLSNQKNFVYLAEIGD